MNKINQLRKERSVLDTVFVQLKQKIADSTAEMQEVVNETDRTFLYDELKLTLS